MQIAPEWVVKILQGAGLSGVFIFVLLMFVAAMATVIAAMHRAKGKADAKRENDVQVLTQLVETCKATFRENIDATRARNEVTAELSMSFAKLTSVIDQLNQRISFQYDAMKDDIRDLESTIGPVGDAMRVLNGSVLEVRNAALDIQQRVIANGVVAGDMQSRAGAVAGFLKELNDKMAILTDLRSKLGAIEQKLARRRK